MMKRSILAILTLLVMLLSAAAVADEQISFEENTVSIFENEKYLLVPVLSDGLQGGTVTYKSGDNRIVVVNADGELTGVEIVERAVEDARENARLNGVQNARFFACDAAEAAVNGRPDVVIVDPPRKGCDRRTLDIIADSGAPRLVYVSCDSATLARDLIYLRERGFVPARACAVDMFPKTVDVETVVRLSRSDMNS